MNLGWRNLGWLMVGVLVTAGCASRTHVELDSAQAPAVQAVDGADGQNDAAVVGAGVVEIDDLPLPITTPAPVTDQADAPTTSAPDEQAGSDQAGSDQAAAMIDELCSSDRRNLRVAIEAFRAEFDDPPTSERELVASGYIREQSNVYDVRVDGSIVPSDDTCAD